MSSHGDDTRSGYGGLASVNTLEDLKRALEAFSEAAGFRYFFLRAVLRSQCGPGRTVKLGNYPQAWLEHFAAQNYRTVDPVAAHARSCSAPLRLNDLDLRDFPLITRFLQDARDFGVYGGVSIPLCSPKLWGYLNFNAPVSEERVESEISNAFLFAAHVVETLPRVLPEPAQISFYDRLSRREREVLFWASSGKTAWETSQILGISERTVVAHLTHGMSVLGCSNKTQAVNIVSAELDADQDLLPLRQGY
ncbi:LuxR family transcriptional regulator [Rhabdaerophilum sp.]|uniref:LuxR family transcriptional regulator n=1 Tax=Rhabdaerophilum sp. TaxID=2717341 RepID=UPI0038D3D56C